MKVVRDTAPPTGVPLGSIGYGAVCNLQGEGDIPFMLVKTDQPQVYIGVQDSFRKPRTKFHKVLNLETGYFRVIPVGTLVYPATVTLYIEGAK